MLIYENICKYFFGEIVKDKIEVARQVTSLIQIVSRVEFKATFSA